MVLLVLPLLIGFGVWQLQRAEWKTGLLVEIAAHEDAPIVAVSPGMMPDGLQFRRVRMTLDCPAQTPKGEAGRNLQGRPGWAFIATCYGPDGESIQFAIGWSDRADGWADGDLPETLVAEGVLMPATATKWRIVGSEALPPLQPVAPPTADNLPNNHFSYAMQWFSFAAILAVIYALWLRRRLAHGDNAA